MIGYRNEIRIAVLMERGSVDAEELEHDSASDLDRAIVKLAKRSVSKSEKVAFFFAYNCKDTWDDVLELFNDKLLRDVDIDSVVRYGNRATEKIVGAAENARELEGW